MKIDFLRREVSSLLNDLIIIEKRIEGKDCLSDDTWIKDSSCWACREKTVTTEDYNGHGYNMIVESTYKVRKSSKVENLDTRDYRIFHKGKVYNIKSIIPDGKKGEFLKIECKMVS